MLNFDLVLPNTVNLTAPARPLRRVLRFAIFCHRWLGLPLCLLFVLWFTSGVVMMYWGFPEISTHERLSHRESLRAEAIQLSAEAAYQRLARTDPPDEASLIMLDGRPLYRFRAAGSRAAVYADTGDKMRPFDQGSARRIAAAWLEQPATAARFDRLLTTADQWTVTGEFRALRPLFKFAFPAGDEVYVSQATGEVVQHTTRASRFAAYFGAIPHWLYFTPLRANGRLWSRVVIWSSGIACALCLLGLLIGAWRYAASGQVPYRGQKRLHTTLGLSFGAIACTWTFSGLLSMEPFDWQQPASDSAALVDAVLRTQPLDLHAFADEPPRTALRRAGLNVKQLELANIGGEPYYLARDSPSRSRILPLRGEPLDRFDGDRILRLIRQAVQPLTIAESRVIDKYDAYYLDRARQHPLPALLVRVNDKYGSTHYIDLSTARVAETYDSRSLWNRWLYHGLHSWNLPWLYRNRPAWDVWLLALLIGGTALSITAVIMAFQLLSRTFRQRRRA